ncbi:hypothetical protein MTP04_22330 [Lysinibacillus sp. PLM2]|nr:hypothetical protein MTP04_22330 [Lysinibacillus sp. PLM2]
MLIITNGNQTEPILESNYEKTEERNGTLQISFSSFNFAQNVGHDLLDWEVLVEDEDGHEYKVKQYQQNGNSKSSTATHIYFDLVDIRQENVFGGTRTIEQFLDFIFAGTGWSYTIDDDLSGQSQVIPNFGQANIIELVNTILAAFKCERKILPGKVVRFGKIIGEDNDLQYRYKYNIADINKSIDTITIKTQIRGYNSDRTIDVTYTSPLANHPRIGVRVADPVETDDYVTADEMRSFLATQIPNALPEAIEVSVVEVDGEVGDFVWVIHEGIDLEYQTRILSKTTKRNYADSTVTVGESTVKTVEDILIAQRVAITQNAKLTRSKFEQTNDRITAEVEEIGQSIASLEIQADSIELEVSNVEGNVANLQIQANQIQSTVSAQSTTIGTMQSQITQMADEIELKVSEEDFNGNEIISKINLSSTTATIQARNIDLVGAVNVLSDISGNMGTITAGRLLLTEDIQVGSNITMYGSSGGRLRFPATGCWISASSSGDITMEAWNDIEFVAQRIDFGGAELDGAVESSTSGLGLAYSSSANRLYIRLNGNAVATIDATEL